MNLIFDFDGTLCDSTDALLSLMNPYLVKLRQEKVTKKELQTIGATKALEKRKVPKILFPFVVLHVRHELAKLIPTLNAFKDIEKVIKKLSKGNTLGIITSNSTKNVEVFLRNNNLSNYFDFVYSSINYLSKSARIKNALNKHNLKMEDTYFIGDETRDIASAESINLKTVAVSWGTESEKLLSKANPDFIVNKPTDLIKIFN